MLLICSQQVIAGRAIRGIGVCLDHFRNRLGSGQVDATGQKGQFGEFARFGYPGTIGNDLLLNALNRLTATVTEYLHLFLPRVGSSRGHVNSHHFIDYLATAIHEVTVAHHERFGLSGFRCNRTEVAFKISQASPAGNPQSGDTTGTGGSDDGDYGVAVSVSIFFLVIL
jgi:hypothetical protein